MTAPASLSKPTAGKNRQWRLKTQITAAELIGPEHFDLDEAPIPEPTNGEILVQTLWLGTSPAQRGYITESTSMHEKVSAGAVMRGRGVAVVVASKSADYQEGDLVIATTGWQDFSIQKTDRTDPFAVAKIVDPIKPYSSALSLLGGAGLTAYFGLTDVGHIKPGDTVLISAAAGGIGSCAAQIARILGARVVGIAGGERKCRWLREELGVETCIDYKSDNLDVRLTDLCPNGIDVFFDNVGGDQLQTALKHLALGARVVICGYISTDYSEASPGPSNYVYLLRQRARMQGFFIFDYQQDFAHAEQILKKWYREQRLVDNTDPVFGLEQMPNALRSLFLSQNLGVRVCQVAADPD